MMPEEDEWRTADGEEQAPATAFSVLAIRGPPFSVHRWGMEPSAT